MEKKPRGGEPGRCAARGIDDVGARLRRRDGRDGGASGGGDGSVCVFARTSPGWRWWACPDGYGSGFFRWGRAKGRPLPPSLYARRILALTQSLFTAGRRLLSRTPARKLLLEPQTEPECRALPLSYSEHAASKTSPCGSVSGDLIN
ncbi:hypothetical protein HPB50_009791 [Hyalomma asiaticum]|uniref:Uncharacterized protein n=1 Tax=Hyalomma asiaticum TaxID=266040 RepID=A0ACB7RYA6_HYAAI|nr:hypothetical protein HPB50_009791 [Hyalomma asiaticum]